MQTIVTIGLDIAKSVFQVHGVDADGDVVIRRQLKRRSVLAFFEKLSPCLVGIEACASSHQWSRELQALGHTVRLMPPGYVKPYVKRQKNDAADAEAICEAVTRANMRFVPTKTPEQQSGLLLHRTRHLFIRQQTAVNNAIRGHLAEFGIVAPVGRRGVEELLNVVADPSDRRVPEMARACLLAFGAQLGKIKEQVLEFDRLIRAWHRSNEMSMRLDEAPGVGPVLATALVAAVADPKSFRSGRNFSAWIGIVPKQHSSGGKNRLGNISKQGDRYLRGLFVAGALAVIRYAKIHWTADRVRAHVFLCMLAYHVEWHLRHALAPLLFHDTDLATAKAERTSPVAATEPSDAVKLKKATRRSAEGQRVMSFADLMAHLGTLARNTMRVPARPKHRFNLHSRPTALQEAAFELIGLDPVRVQ
jgi:transposase